MQSQGPVVDNAPLTFLLSFLVAVAPGRDPSRRPASRLLEIIPLDDFIKIPVLFGALQEGKKHGLKGK